MKVLTMRYRVVRVTDGKGGFSETLASPVPFYGELEWHDDQITISGLHIHEDVRIGDIIEVLDT